ncbi:MAG TPA: hypothetical protein VM368_02725 [Flavisolibacter sp.]|nr:hypothetical protein [Flavisolibacter sp.]
MKNIVLFLLVITNSFNACSQEPNQIEHSFNLGNRIVSFQEFKGKKKAPFILLSVHSNERTGIETAEAFSQEHKVPFFQILNENKRMIEFSNNEKKFSVDPNRIYTDEGVRASLSKNGNYDTSDFVLLQQFNKFILEKLDPDKVLIAMHNNTEGEYDINRYLKDLKADADSVHVNEKIDADDFFLTTDATIFCRLKCLNYNVILQNNSGAADDGSLSVLYGKRNLPYVNIEAQHGHKEEQVRMLNDLIKVLKEQ